MDLTDVDSLIAEGLTRALTGFAAPHTQLQESKDIVDLTWTHGVHPFRPFGKLPAEGSDPDAARAITRAARRTMLVARAHHVMKRAHDISERTQGLNSETASAFHTLMAIKGSSEQAVRAYVRLISYRIFVLFLLCTGHILLLLFSKVLV
jgi:hypothetical protein